MKEIKTLPSKAFYLGKVKTPSWLSFEFYIYTDGKRYYYLWQRSYADGGSPDKVRVIDAFYRTSSLKSIKKYIKEVLQAFGLKIDFAKTEAFCYNYLFFSA